MRAPVVGVAFSPNRERVIAAARASAEITHAHPLGMEGAVLIAVATAAALEGASGDAMLEQAMGVSKLPEFAARLEVARTWLSGERATASQVRRELGTQDDCG